jgi:hypothetical protein
MNQLKNGQLNLIEFSKEEIQIAKKHMKNCSPSVAVKEMQIKSTLKFHLTPVRIAIIKNTTNMCWWGCGEKGTVMHWWWNASWCNYSAKKFGDFLKI